MGREIRRVPPGWEHPRQKCEHSPWSGGCDEAEAHGGKCLHPLYDRDFETAADEWLAANTAWEDGSDPDRAKYGTNDNGERLYYWEWDSGPPDRAYYHPKWADEERTAYQMYETVSEGTPVTPVFETPEGLIDYLVNHGDYWDQRRGEGGWSRENAERFVGVGWAPSMMVRTSAAGVEIKKARDGQF